MGAPQRIVRFFRRRLHVMLIRSALKMAAMEAKHTERFDFASPRTKDNRHLYPS